MSLRTLLAGAFCGIASGLTGFLLGHFAYYPLSLSPLACFSLMLAGSSAALLFASLRRDGRSQRYALFAALTVFALALIIIFGITWGWLVYQSSQLTPA